MGKFTQSDRVPYSTLECYSGFSSPLVLLESYLGGSDGKESARNAGDPGSIPGSERSLGERNGYPLQNFCLESPMNRGDWWATVHGMTRGRTRLSD